jgi:predicted acyl esterase
MTSPRRLSALQTLPALLGVLVFAALTGHPSPALAASATAPSAATEFAGPAVASGASPPIYEYSIENGWLTMPDGVRLSVSFVKPRPHLEGETFPVLFDFYPYRKDEYPSDYSTYFARRGYIVATADIRGAGSSEGQLPGREYSEQELDDAVVIIDQLSRLPESNGRVGMWGKSWGGFNSIQVAMRRPPALKAILAVMATDDLFHDDVHHMEGAFHLDQFMPVMDKDNSLPQVPDYAIDNDYFSNRFDRYPWLLTYTKNQLDGPFWRKNSLRWQYDKIDIPCYLIGGLLDGYRDSIPRMLENMKVPIRAAIGPYKHDWPNDGRPGPNYEWQHEAVRFWDQWLKDRDAGILDDAPLALFVRDGHPPDINQQTTPGHWIATDWPVPGTRWRAFHPTADHGLAATPGTPAVESLRYVPSYGVNTGLWWGEPTDDMRPDDAGALVYDGPVLKERFIIAGMPRVRLKVSADAPLAHWVARLEDVQPDGTVSLVAGALLNGSQRNSRLEPEALIPGKVYELAFDMHFTTWTFEPGHRVRLAVSNALWPMIWPTPYPMTTKLYLNDAATRVELPVIPDVQYRDPAFLPPEPQEPSATGRYFESVAWPAGLYRFSKDLWTGLRSLEWKGHGRFENLGNQYDTWERNYYETNDHNPAESRFSGEAGHRIDLGDRKLEIKSEIEVRSDATDFHITITRYLYEDGRLVRTRAWQETIPRMFN